MKQILLFLFSISVLYAENNTTTCEQGNKNDCNTRGVAYGIKGEYIEALKLYEKACDLNSSTGCSNLGYMYMNGQAVKRNFVMAVRFLDKAVDLGSWNFAATNLGIIYEKGYGAIDVNTTMATDYFRKGCLDDNGFACNYMGTVEYKAKQEKRALGYYYASCRLGNGFGCYNLGQAAYRGQGMKVDLSIAVRYFMKGCEHNIAYACDTLAGMIYRGEGGTMPDQNLEKEYWKKACDLGLKSSCNM